MVYLYKTLDNTLKYKSVCLLICLFLECYLCNETVVINVTTTSIQILQLTSPGPILLNSTQSSLNSPNNSTGTALFTPQKPPPALGLTCKNSSECKANFSSCKNNTCSCNSGYIPSKELLRCLQLATKLGDECSEDEQCTGMLNKLIGPSICLNFACSCAIGMSLVGEKCQGPTVLKGQCSSDDDCTIPKSSCVDNTCSCLPGFLPNAQNNFCLPGNMIQLQKLSGPGGCREDIQCQHGMGDLAICQVDSDGSSCQCQPGTHIINSKCVSYKDLGETCSSDVECASPDMNSEAVSSRICNQGICKCSSLGWTQVGNICKGGACERSLAGVLFAVVIAVWILR